MRIRNLTLFDPSRSVPVMTTSAAPSSAASRRAHHALCLVTIFAGAYCLGLGGLASGLFRPSFSSAEDTISLAHRLASNSATGTAFHGDKTRRFTGELKFFDGWELHADSSAARGGADDTSFDCRRWSVVTTIFAPSAAVRRAALMEGGWCTVIVADTKTPETYMETSGLVGGDAIHFLSIEDQEEWARSTGSNAIRDFVKSTPYEHFARKNIGYLYALHHGAEFIFDFDDDNMLKEDAVLLANETHLVNPKEVVIGPNVFNHHPLAGASVPNSWPRGFPLDRIQDQAHRGVGDYRVRAKRLSSIAVMQLVADNDPDIDAVHRLVNPLPVTFAPPADKDRSILVPSHSFVPYNAQATIHNKHALWALLLPSTVPGRVSDIWRSYFAQALFRDLQLQVAILPPHVSQERNEHDYMADFQSELDLYFKAGKLVDFLSEWESTADTVPERMEQLWVELYERNYIEVDDVYRLQSWLSALIDTGYEFPVFRRGRLRNVVLMGQFNYANKDTTREVVFWTQKWRRWFHTIVAAGPFDALTVQSLQQNGIPAIVGAKDDGRSSPMGNFGRTLRQYSNDTNIDGVLYLHDDAFLNMQLLYQSLVDGTEVLVTHSAAPSPIFTVQNGDVVLNDGTRIKAKDGAVAYLRKKSGWPHWDKCVGPLLQFRKDRSSTRYRESDGSLLAVGHGQSDFMHVPTKYASVFGPAAMMMTRHRVFLECGAPKLTDILRRKANATIRKVSLCTSWDYNGARGRVDMLQSCGFSKAMTHPFKIHQHGLRVWNNAFGAIDLGEPDMLL